MGARYAASLARREKSRRPRCTGDSGDDIPLGVELVGKFFWAIYVWSNEDIRGIRLARRQPGGSRFVLDETGFLRLPDWPRDDRDAISPAAATSRYQLRRRKMSTTCRSCSECRSDGAGIALVFTEDQMDSFGLTGMVSSSPRIGKDMCERRRLTKWPWN